MSPRLVDHLQHSLNSRQLMDPSMRRAPEQLNPWAVFCAWCVDWFVAYAFAAIAVNAWMSFVGPLGLDRLPSDARFMVSAYGERMSLILAPVFFFSMSFLGILFNNMTPGLRLFKHRVEHSTVKSSLLWSWASTVSIAVAGMPLLTSWLDLIASTETRSEYHHAWALTQGTYQEMPAPNLVDQALENATPVEDFKIAA